MRFWWSFELCDCINMDDSKSPKSKENSSNQDNVTISTMHACLWFSTAKQSAMSIVSTVMMDIPNRYFESVKHFELTLTPFYHITICHQKGWVFIVTQSVYICQIEYYTVAILLKAIMKNIMIMIMMAICLWAVIWYQYFTFLPKATWYWRFKSLRLQFEHVIRLPNPR